MKRVFTKTVLSGIQPTGIPHLGNYLGALRQWRDIAQDKTDGAQKFFSLMDLHALTVPRTAEELRRDVLDGACTLLASGIVPSDTCSIMVQSQVKQHLELYWILQCLTKIGQLQRMTQFKDKAGHKGDHDMGLLVYPVLMAADILVYRATHVPVGEDQVQHLELTRDLADAFNRHYASLANPLLIKPATVMNKDTKKIMSLFDPNKKMSKSEPKADSRILLTDTPDQIRKKISRATTDSLGVIQSDSLEARKSILNLISMLAACAEIPESQARVDCDGMNMVTFKKHVTEAVVTVVDPIRLEFERLKKDEAYVVSVLQQGQRKASEAAERTMVDVRQAIGMLPSAGR